MTNRRKALGLGLAASAIALSGSSKARAADALTIDAGGVNIDTLRIAKSLTVTGNAAFTTAAGANTLDVQSAARTGAAHPKGLALYVTSSYANSKAEGDAALAEFRDSNASQGIGIGFNTIYATGSNADQELILRARGKSSVRIDSDVSVQKGLTVAGDATVKNRLAVGGSMKIVGDNTLEFGAPADGKDKEGDGKDSGKISYGRFEANSLCIVGAGTKAENRKITFWAGGGAKFRGRLTVVEGDESIHPVPVADEALRLLRGVVNKDGVILGGTGFTTKKVAGHSYYDITFSRPFSSLPAASASQLAVDGVDSLTTDNALITTISAATMRVKTGGSSGGESDRSFTFIVIGPW
jgi:hypothetical protein